MLPLCLLLFKLSLVSFTRLSFSARCARFGTETGFVFARTRIGTKAGFAAGRTRFEAEIGGAGGAGFFRCIVLARAGFAGGFALAGVRIFGRSAACFFPHAQFFLLRRLLQIEQIAAFFLVARIRGGRACMAFADEALAQAVAAHIGFDVQAVFVFANDPQLQGLANTGFVQGQFGGLAVRLALIRRMRIRQLHHHRRAPKTAATAQAVAIADFDHFGLIDFAHMKRLPQQTPQLLQLLPCQPRAPQQQQQ